MQLGGRTRSRPKKSGRSDIPNLLEKKCVVEVCKMNFVKPNLPAVVICPKLYKILIVRIQQSANCFMVVALVVDETA